MSSAANDIMDNSALENDAKIPAKNNNNSVVPLNVTPAKSNTSNNLHPLETEVFVVYGHGQLGYMLSDRIRTFGFEIHHLSHSQELPKDASIVINAIPHQHQHRTIKKQRENGYTGIIIDTSQQATILDSEVNNDKNVTGKNTISDPNNKQSCGFAKAFGDVSSYDLAELDRQRKVSFTVASSWQVFEKIAHLQRLMNIEPVMYSTKSKNYQEFITKRYTRYFPRSTPALIYGATVLLFTIIYQFIRATPIAGGGALYEDILLHELHNCFAWSAVWVLSAVFLLGGLAKLRTKPLEGCIGRILVPLLNARKQLGLIGCSFAFIHILMVVILFSPYRYSSFYAKNDDGTTNNAVMLWHGQVIITAGVFAAACMLPIVISSFSGQWTRDEWQCLQLYFGLAMLMFATVHVTIIGMEGEILGQDDVWYLDNWKYPFPASHSYMPSAEILCGAALFFTLGVRLFVYCKGRWFSLPRDGRLQGYANAKMTVA